MMGRLIAVINTVLGWFMRRVGRVTAGSGSEVRWWGLRAARHGGRVAIGRESFVRCRIDFNSLRSDVLIDVRCYLGASRVWTRRALGDRIGHHNAFVLERATGNPSRAMPTLRMDSPAIKFVTH